MVVLRLTLSAAVLLLLVRPNIRALTRSTWASVAQYGLALAGMNLCFYLALARIPLGVTVTLEALGPLALSVIAGRTWRSALCAAVALGGVVLLGWSPGEHLDGLGVTFALLAGAFWAAYVMFTKQLGRRLDGMTGLSLGLAVGAVATLPLLWVNGLQGLTSPKVLLLGLVVALMSSAIPYALEMESLRRISASVFAVLLALAPAIAALAGLVVLHQRLGWVSWLGITLVVAAAMLASSPRARLVGTAAAKSPQ